MYYSSNYLYLINVIYRSFPSALAVNIALSISESPSNQISTVSYDYSLYLCNFKRCVILIKRRVDAVKRFYPASFMCLEQATTWILSLYMFPFFTLYSESRGKRWLFVLLKLVEMLTSLIKLSLHKRVTITLQFYIKRESYVQYIRTYELEC